MLVIREVQFDQLRVAREDEFESIKSRGQLCGHAFLRFRVDRPEAREPVAKRVRQGAV